MLISLMKSKIHRAIVSDANLDYVGSVTIDEDLMDAADIFENEKVKIVDNNNGNRFVTYVIKGERGSGMICINGAASRLVHKGDTIIIMAFGLVEREEAKEIKPKVVFVDGNNKVIKVKNFEEHGQKGAK